MKKIIAFILLIAGFALPGIAHEAAGPEWAELRTARVFAEYAAVNEWSAATEAAYREVLTAVAKTKIPKDVRSPLEVDFALDDVRGLVKKLPETLDADSKTKLFRALQELSEQAEMMSEGPHGGIVRLAPSAVGIHFIEIKLHDDKGDLECWLAKDVLIRQAVDLSLDAKISMKIKNRDVSLAVRNRARNEDEDDKNNIRAGKTNYFIFPGDTGADATWLMGKTFKAATKISYSLGESNANADTGLFELSPHTH